MTIYSIYIMIYIDRRNIYIENDIILANILCERKAQAIYIYNDSICIYDVICDICDMYYGGM